jgi:hypothetical protein
MSAAMRRAARPGTSAGTANLDEGMKRQYLGKRKVLAHAVEMEKLLWHANMPNVRIATDNFAIVMSAVRPYLCYGSSR